MADVHNTTTRSIFMSRINRENFTLIHFEQNKTLLILTNQKLNKP